VTLANESDLEELYAQNLPVARILLCQAAPGAATAATVPAAAAEPKTEPSQEASSKGKGKPKNRVEKQDKAMDRSTEWGPARLDKFLNNLAKHLAMLSEGKPVTGKIAQLLSRGLNNTGPGGAVQISQCLKQSCAAHPSVLRVLSDLSTNPAGLVDSKVPQPVQDITHQAVKSFLDELPPVSSTSPVATSMVASILPASSNPGSHPPVDWSSGTKSLPKLLKNLSRNLQAMETDSGAANRVVRLVAKASWKANDEDSLKTVMACLHDAAEKSPCVRLVLSSLADGGEAEGGVAKAPLRVQALIQQGLVDPTRLPVMANQPGAKGPGKWQLPRVEKFLNNLQPHLSSLPDSAAKVAAMLSRASAHASNEGVKVIVSFLRKAASEDPDARAQLELLANCPEALGLSGSALSIAARAVVVSALTDPPAGGEESEGDLQAKWDPTRVAKFMGNFSRHLASMGSNPKDTKRAVFMLSKACSQMEHEGKAQVAACLRHASASNPATMELMSLLAHQPEAVPLKRKVPEDVHSLALLALGSSAHTPAEPTALAEGPKPTKAAKNPRDEWSPEQQVRFMTKLSRHLACIEGGGSGKGAWKTAHMMARACNNIGSNGKLELVTRLRTAAASNPAVGEQLHLLAHSFHSFGRKRPVPVVVQMLALWAQDNPVSIPHGDDMMVVNSLYHSAATLPAPASAAGFAGELSPPVV